MQGHQLILRKTFFYCCSLVCAVVFYLHWSAPQWQSKSHTVRPFSHQRLYPSNWTLIDLKKFQFLLNSDVCDGSNEQPVELLILVTSHPGHVDLRRSFRAGLPASILRTMGIRRIFLLGRIDPSQKDYHQVNQSVIDQEHLIHQDLVQGNFLESYRHLSYKHVMGLKYAAHYCPQASMVIKMDDDIAVDIFQLSDWAKKEGLSGLQIAGAVMTGNELIPLRQDAISKWSVTHEEYPMTRYPPFVSGWAYVTTTEACKALIQHSESSPFFWIDDVYVTGMLADLSSIRRIDIRSRLTIYQSHLECCLRHNQTLCDYWILPADEKDPSSSLETFYSQSLGCKLMKSCSNKGEAPASRCVIVHSPSSNPRMNDGRVIHGQVIPLF